MIRSISGVNTVINPCGTELVINILRPRQNVHHFPDHVFKWIFFNENVWISIKISLNFLSRDPINNIPSLVQIMTWCRPGNKPLSEPMMVSLLMHLCITRLQLVNSLYMKNNIFIIGEEFYIFYSDRCEWTHWGLGPFSWTWINFDTGMYK